jgi:NAD(P)-dependent dehydrogenase (short-subunit alcohol dehydrogenase family)
MSNPIRTAVITGASSGIGFALANAYLQRGYNVIGNARTQEQLLAAAAMLGEPRNFIAVQGDIAQPETTRRIFDRALTAFGRVDILINNVGLFVPKPVGSYTVEDVERVVETDLKGFFFPSQAAAVHMAARRSGHIVSITPSAVSQPNASVPALLPVLAQGGLHHATRALALELAPFNVKVNAVARGIIDAPSHAPELRPFLNSLQPAGRIGTTQDIVDAVLYLTDAQFTTGTVLAVDGGAAAGKW